jgi:hypothetical protein
MKAVIKSAFSALGFDIQRRQNPRHDFYPRNMSHEQTCYETDEAFHSLYHIAQDKTQMRESDNAFRRQRHYTLNHLLRNIDALEGDFCELGCWRGLSAYQTARYIASRHPNTRFCILDSFEGLSEYKPEDLTGRDYDRDAMRRALACPEDIVRRNLAEFNFVSYHQGWIPAQFREVQERKFIWVHVDVDLYQPIKDSAEFFYPRMKAGAIMLFDDYGYTQFPGAKKAVDEFVVTLPPRSYFFQPLTTGQAFLVKLSDG